MTSAPAGTLLAAEDLRKAYGPTTALDGAAFSIHPGEAGPLPRRGRPPAPPPDAPARRPPGDSPG